jgi:hypothetical protein
MIFEKCLRFDMSEQKPSGGMILYPVKYQIDMADADKSYAICRDINDVLVIFLLNPEDRHKAAAAADSSKSIPQLRKFAEKHKAAKNPCYANLANNKRAPHGIFVGEQVVPKGVRSIDFSGDDIAAFGGNTVEFPVFEGKWASVVRDSVDGYRAPVGFGYLEVNFSHQLSPNGNMLKLKYEEICRILSKPDDYPDEDLVQLASDKIKIASQLRDDRKKRFVGVILHAKNIATLEVVTQESVRNQVEKIHNHYTKNGLYGGAIIRVRDGNRVISRLCKPCDAAYDHGQKKVKEFEVVFADFLRYGGSRIIDEARKKGYSVDVIPTERFNCGNVGNDTFKKEMADGSGKILKTYIDKAFHENPLADIQKNNGFMYAKVCMRLAITVDGSENFLLSAIHAFSKPLGSILSIDRDGKPAYALDAKDSTSSNRAGSTKLVA